ncbi:MAG: type II toxin-antitoxin system prevent-host-death family antitoxin [Chloroflexi bacterium]|nr:type II toxin-antitoxin system prevent-host-death family antitoxin [Chloroflexota bacterium]MBI5712547.1 type II toxin-antitoxin system prevent-host-death family antitoxin [Chloroflexota bacterium]
MQEVNVGVRELKNQLSKYLRQVKAGQTILITEHGQMVGRIIPMSHSLEDRMGHLRQSGVIAWNGKNLKRVKPVARTRGKKTVAQLLLEDRE